MDSYYTCLVCVSYVSHATANHGVRSRAGAVWKSLWRRGFCWEAQSSAAFLGKIRSACHFEAHCGLRVSAGRRQ